MNEIDPIEALTQSGLKPIVIDENFDWGQLRAMFPTPTEQTESPEDKPE